MGVDFSCNVAAAGSVASLWADLGFIGAREGIFALMSETATGEPTKTASGAHDDQELHNFPLLRTRAVKALMGRSRTVRVLLSSSPAFRLLMFGSSISMLGTRISTVAFPMLVLHLNKSPFITGLVAFAAIAPSLLFYVPAGVIVDRWDPRRVMLVSELLRGLAIASVVLALTMFRAHLNIWFLMLAMVAEEIFEIFSTLADRRYLNRVIERDKIASQQASIEVRAHAAVLAGRPVGPFLFSIQPFLPFLADAVSFVASVASLLLLGKVAEPQSETRRLAPRQVIGEIGHGFRWLKRDRRASVTISLMAFTSMVAQALIMIFLVEAHSKQLSTVAIGVVLAASGAGGAVGAFCSRAMPDVVRSSWLSIQMVAWSVALAFLALAGGQSVYLSAVAMFILGLTGAIGNVEFGTYLIRKVADDMIAKITGIGQMLAIGACALGPVLGGYFIQQFGVRGALLILLCIVMLLALVSLLTPGAARRKALPIQEGEGFAPVGGRVLSVNPMSLELAPAFSSSAASVQSRGGAHEAIAGGYPVLLRRGNGRLSSRMARKSLTCRNAGRESGERGHLEAYPNRQHQIREESGGFRRHWKPQT
jgi:MFS family permease